MLPLLQLNVETLQSLHSSLPQILLLTCVHLLILLDALGLPLLQPALLFLLAILWHTAIQTRHTATPLNVSCTLSLPLALVNRQAPLFEELSLELVALQRLRHLLELGGHAELQAHGDKLHIVVADQG